MRKLLLSIIERLPGVPRHHLYVWLTVLGVLIVAGFVGIRLTAENQSIIFYTIALFFINSVLFFAVSFELPKMKVMLLTFMVILILLLLGEIILTRLSPQFLK